MRHLLLYKPPTQTGLNINCSAVFRPCRAEVITYEGGVLSTGVQWV